jgi:hypothetical protein
MILYLYIYIYFTSFGVLSELQPQNAALRQHATVHHDPMWSWWSPSCACQICTVCLGHPGVFQVPILCSVLRSLLGLETLKSDRQVCYGRHWPMLVRWFTGFKNGGLSCANCWFTGGYTRNTIVVLPIYPIISPLISPLIPSNIRIRVMYVIFWFWILNIPYPHIKLLVKTGGLWAVKNIPIPPHEILVDRLSYYGLVHHAQ